MPPLRVAHVTDTFLPKIGGAEIAIDKLVRAMSAAGDTCVLLAQRQGGGEIDTPYLLRRYANPRSSRWAPWWIRRHLRRLEREAGPFDVVIAHHAFPPGRAAVRFAIQRGIPSIVYPRGGDIYEVSRFRKKKHAWDRLRWALQNASAVVCASNAMEDIVREIIGNDGGGRIARIPNGVDVDELSGECTGSRFAGDPRLAGPYVLALGRLIHRKGFHLLLDAFAALPANEWRLVIAGEGRELDALRKRAAPLGQRIVFAGLVDGADKRWLLQHCAFMAAPSLEESFGNVALEAMACGKPVIASQASGFAEIVRDGENGRLVPVGDVEALRAAVSEYQHADLSAAGAAALSTAQSFAWPRIAAMWGELIRKLPQAAG
jgi:glycosyltransferase involved in cell wall biosynthesis